MKVEKVVERYILMLKEQGINNFIENIKHDDFLVNPYSGKLSEDKKRVIENLTILIDERGQEDERILWSNTIMESKLINEIYRKFYENPLNQIVNTENPLESFLIMTEQFMQYVNNIVDGNEKKNKDLGLNFYVIENSNVDKINFYTELHTTLTCIINLVLSSLRYYELPNHMLDTNIEISEKEIQSSYNHFNNAHLNDLINYAVSSWKYGGRIVRRFDNTITFDILGDLDESYFVINQRKDSKANKTYLTVAQIIKDMRKNYPQGYKISEYLNIEEVMTCFYLMDYLSIDDLNECTYCARGTKYDELSIKELIRAYCILIEVSKDKISTRKIVKNNLENWGIILEKETIFKLFFEGGINDRKINFLIEQLTYKKNVDVLDAPLIETNRGYLLLPNLLVKIDVAKLVLSLIEEIGTRGSLFENEIRKRFTDKGFKCSNLFLKDVEEYQCDLVVLIADDLYICECKAWNECKNLMGYNDMLQKMNDAKEQLDRIADKYMENIDYVNEKLSFEKGHKFKNVTKLVITLNMQGLHRKMGDVYFVDLSCLARFLDREKPGISVFGKSKGFIPFEGYKEYEGNINNFKFMTMIKNPANIELTRKNKIVGINSFILGDIKLQIPMYTTEHQPTRFIPNP